MSNYNYLLILKELENGFNNGKPLSGIARLEREFGVIELNLSFINLAPISSGEYHLYIFGNNGKVYTFPLSCRPTSFHKTLDALDGVEKGFASALVYIKDDIPLTIAFGKSESFDFSMNLAKKCIAEKCLNDRRYSKRKMEQSEPAEQPPNPKKPQPTSPTEPLSSPVLDPPSLDPPQEYNDEAVATENYFEIEEQLKSKLDLIKDRENESLSNADGNPFNRCQEEKEEDTGGTSFLSNEEDFFASQGEPSSSTKPFFITAEKELNSLFSKFPSYDNLKCYFPDSKWVKISYDTDRFYIVGLIKENKKEKYICYGVPEKYSKEPPKELKGYCTFIPLSIFDMQGDGFWMMFQDAISGECVFPK